MKLVAQKIVETRKLKGFTQEDLAEEAKVNLRTIQRIENAESEPRGKTLSLISQALNLDLTDLIDADDKIKNTSKSKKIVETLFLAVFNLILAFLVGFLTFDSEANQNSKTAAFLLSILIPFFIVIYTPRMSGLKRMLKFGIGYLVYFVLAALISYNGPIKGITSGLYLCMFISLTVLYFGKRFIDLTLKDIYNR